MFAIERSLNNNGTYVKNDATGQVKTWPTREEAKAYADLSQFSYAKVVPYGQGSEDPAASGSKQSTSRSKKRS